MGEFQHHVVYPLMGDRRVRRDADRGAKGSSVSMSSELWTRLPAQLVERVLLFLPAEAQSRLQLVCKTWRLLFTSPRFREDSTSRALAYHHRLCLLWDQPAVSAKADHPLTANLSFIPAKFSDFWRYYRPNYFGFYNSNLSWVWYTKQDGKLWLCLVNLEEKTCIELPPLSLRPLSPSSKELRVEFVGKVMQEPGSVFFHITVLLNDFDNDDVLIIVRYSSRGGVWTTRQLDLATQRNRYCYHALLYQDSRVQVIYAQDDAICADSFWQLASFSIENTGAGDYHCLAKGSLPQSCLRLKDRLLAHNRGIFCIRLGDSSGMRRTISIFLWTIDNGKHGDEYASNMVRVSVLTANHLDPEMRGRDCEVERVEMINNTILILLTGTCGSKKNPKPFLRVMGYDVQKKSWRRLVF